MAYIQPIMIFSHLDPFSYRMIEHSRYSLQVTFSSRNGLIIYMYFINLHYKYIVMIFKIHHISMTPFIWWASPSRRKLYYHCHGQNHYEQNMFLALLLLYQWYTTNDKFVLPHNNDYNPYRKELFHSFALSVVHNTHTIVM